MFSGLGNVLPNVRSNRKRIDRSNVTKCFRIKVKLNFEIARLSRLVSHFVELLAFYFLESFISEFRFSPWNIEKRPIHGKDATEQAFSQDRLVRAHEVRERRTSLIVIRKSDFELAIVEDELLSTIIAPLEFHHETQLVILADHPALSFHAPTSTDKDPVDSRSLNRTRFRGGANSCGRNRIQVPSNYVFSAERAVFFPKQAGEQSQNGEDGKECGSRPYS